jgi:hypothetical protein
MIQGKLDIPVEKVLEEAGITEVRYHHFTTYPDERKRVFRITNCTLLKGEFIWGGGHCRCSFKEPFCRRVGRTIALRRAIAQLDIKHRRNGNKKES